MFPARYAHGFSVTPGLLQPIDFTAVEESHARLGADGFELPDIAPGPQSVWLLLLLSET